MTSPTNQTVFTVANLAQLVVEAVLQLQSQAVGDAMSQSHFTRDALSVMAVQGVREKVASA